MNSRNILIIGIPLLILVVVGYFVFSASKISEPPREENTENTKPPVFIWKYEKDNMLNLDGFPQTNIFLEATYPSGAVQTKLIDTTPGSCNDLPDPDEGSVSGSTNIQCYSAGLGYRFKVTKGEESYLVERKTFEESLPDYNPPLYEYEVFAEFPLVK